MPTLYAGQTLPLSVAAGQTLVIKELSGTATVTGSSSAREDASVNIGAGFVTYGPQAATSSLSITTTGICEWQIVSGDATPASQPVYLQSGALVTADGGFVASGLPNGVVNLKASNSKNWLKARAAARGGAARARVGIIGDSTKVGQGAGAASGGANSQAKGPVSQLAKLLSATGTPAVVSSFFGDGCAARYAETLPTQDPRITFGANWSSTFNNNQLWPGGSGIGYANGAVNNLSFAPTEVTDSVTIWYYSYGTNGGFSVNVNGGSSLGTVNTATNPQKILSQTFTFTRGQNVLNLVPSNNGPFTLLGVEMWDSTTPAVNLLNLSHRGCAVQDHVYPSRNTVPGIALPVLNTYGPMALWIVDLTINDSNGAGNWSTTAEYMQRLTQIVTHLLAPGNTDVWLSVGAPSNTANATNGTLAQYIDIVYQIAATYDLPVLDLSKRWGSYAESSTFYVADGVHINATGYADEVAMISAALSAG